MKRARTKELKPLVLNQERVHGGTSCSSHRHHQRHVTAGYLVCQPVQVILPQNAFDVARPVSPDLFKGIQRCFSRPIVFKTRRVTQPQSRSDARLYIRDFCTYQRHHEARHGQTFDAFDQKGKNGVTTPLHERPDETLNRKDEVTQGCAFEASVLNFKITR